MSQPCGIKMPACLSLNPSCQLNELLYKIHLASNKSHGWAKTDINPETLQFNEDQK